MKMTQMFTKSELQANSDVDDLLEYLIVVYVFTL